MNIFHKSERGFTLIELLVVIAILGILAAVAVPLLIGFIEEGRFEAAASELHHVQLAVTATMTSARLETIPSPWPRTIAPPNSDFSLPRPGTGTDVYVRQFITGGVAALQGTYRVLECGIVEITDFPGLEPGDLPTPRYPP